MTSVDTTSVHESDQIREEPTANEALVPEPSALAPSDRLKSVCLVIALIAAVFMTAGCVQWWRADHDGAVDRARTRDLVMVAAHDNIETLNTLDYRDVEAGLKSWRAVTTGTLGSQLSNVGKDDLTILKDSKKITTGKVVDLALTRLDDKKGTATAIASLEITVKGTTGKPTVKRNRFSAELERVDGKWLLRKLQQVAVTLS